MINIVLFQPEKPSNTGNIIRTASSIGAKVHIIKPLSFSFDDKELKRASMDYINFCEIIFYENLDEFFTKHKLDKIYFITRYGKNIYSDKDFSSPYEDYYVMFGKESSGLPYDLLKNNQNQCLRIPMKPEARSLNLANCVAIVCYEIARQQDYFSLSTYETIKGMNFIGGKK